MESIKFQTVNNQAINEVQEIQSMTSLNLDKLEQTSLLDLAKPKTMTSVQEVDFAKQYGMELSAKEKETIDKYSNMVDITNPNHVAFFGVDSQKKIADFSNRTLDSVKAKDLGEISGQLTGLVGQLTTMSVTEPKGFFGKIFKKAENSVVQIRSNYESASKNVERITRSLENHQVTLIRDISMFDQMYKLNLDYMKELTMYIIAGKQALEKAAIYAKSLQDKAQVSGLPEDAQAYNDYSNMCDRFDRKIHDLELTRMQSIQMAPQIRLLQNNNQALVDKIQTVIVNTIPIWKSQMVIALGLVNSQHAMAAQRAVTDATNDLMRQNADMLKMGSIEVAKEMERGVIDIETLKHTNQSLIDTLTEIQQIQNDGREKRRQAEADLRAIENELKNKLLSFQS